MIHHIVGTPITVCPGNNGTGHGEVVIQVGGIGMRLICSMETIQWVSKQVPEGTTRTTEGTTTSNGSGVQLFTHLKMSDDKLTLYGFWSESERALFRLLINVNKVGPTTAVSVLSGLGVQGTVQAILDGEIGRIVKIKGVGRKTAERMILEMKDKVQGIGIVVEGGSGVHGDIAREAEAALRSLGFTPRESRNAIGRALGGLSSDATAENVVRESLKLISSHS